MDKSSTYLYVASGICYSPAVGAQSGNRIITRYNLKTGLAETFYDFNADGSYDQPGGMVDLGGSILVASNPFDNSTTNIKQIISINKTSKDKNVFYQDATYLPAGAANTVRGFIRSPLDGNLYLSTSATIQKIDYLSKFKLPNYSGIFANGFFNGAAAGMGATTCLGVSAANTTLMNNFLITSSGKAIITHSSSLQNKFAVAPSLGVNLATDLGGNCLSSFQGVSINALAVPTIGAAAPANIPNAVIQHSVSGKVLVAFSGTASNSNSVVAYNYVDSTGVLSNPAVSYFNVGNLFQPTSMFEDSATGDVYVASYGQLASGAAGFIRKFSVDPVTGAMTDGGMFAQSPIATKCVSSMFIGQ